MKKKKDCDFWNSLYMNSRAYHLYYNRLLELAVSMFEWVNLPEAVPNKEKPELSIMGVDSRFLELTLFSDGQAVFFKDDVLGYLGLQCTIGGALNVYRVPTERRAFAANGYNAVLNAGNSVIIYNNYMRLPSMMDIEYFAKRLCNMDRIIDVNINAQKTPILLACDETERNTMMAMYEQFDGNKPFIFGRKNLQNQPISSIKTDAPYIADKVYNIKQEIWNEVLSYLGISNANTQKKERLITDEVSRSMGGTLASRNSRLEMRKKACTEINNMFGLNIDVKYRDDYLDMVQQFANDFGMESEGDL